MEFLDQRREHALALFRIVIGLFFAIHGVQKILGGVSFVSWPAGPMSIIELVGGGLVLIGLWTRWAALISSGAMAYAYFVVHQPKGLLPIQNGGELAAVYSWAFLLLVFTGAGAWSIDSLRKSSKKSFANA